MTDNYRKVKNASEYEFGCPEGLWIARLDNKAWGKSLNLILYFSDANSSKKYWFSVFHANGYKPHDESLDFAKNVEVGDFLELTTKKTKKGNPSLVSARKIAPTSVQELNLKANLGRCEPSP